MPLEQAQFIDSLTPEWPLGSDPRSAGDDHIRMIKQVLQNTFPNMNEAVDVSAHNLNDLTTHFAYVDAGEDANWQRARAQFNNTDNTAYLPLLVGDVPPSEMNQFAAATAISWGQVQNLIYPVGSVIVSARADNPAAWLGFGTWTQRAGNIYAAGERFDIDGLSLWMGVGDVPGYWRTHPEHIFPHQAEGSTSGGEHEHSYIEVYDNGNSHDNDSSGIPNTSYRQQSTTGGGSHGHGVTVNVGTGTLAYVQPGHAFNVWERTA